VPKRRYLATNLRCITSKKSEDLVLLVVQATACGCVKAAWCFTRTFLRDVTGEALMRLQSSRQASHQGHTHVLFSGVRPKRHKILKLTHCSYKLIQLTHTDSSGRATCWFLMYVRREILRQCIKNVFNVNNKLQACISLSLGRDSSVGTETRCGLGGPGIESRWGPVFPHPSTTALGHTQSPVQLVQSLFPGGKASGAGVDHSPSNAEVKERVELYLYSPSGPS
jgi:hypothetical protein